MISIIVPVYNAAATLKRCLGSLRGQTCPDLEILLVDDGSTDRSGAICDRYAREDSRFTVFHTENRGVVSARNLALENCKGDYVMFADADDFVCPAYVRRLHEILTGSDCSVATCEAADLKPEEADAFRTPEKETPRVIGIEEYDYAAPWSHRVVWGALIKRELLDGLEFDSRFACSTDTLFMAQVLKRCRRLVHTPEKLYCYVQYPVSLSKGRFDRKKFDDILVWKEIEKLMGDEAEAVRLSIRRVLLRKCRQALDKMKREKCPDRALRRTVRRELIRRLPQIAGFPESPRKKAGLAARLIWPAAWERIRRRS